MGPHPAVAAIRLAVRRTLRDILREVGPVPAPPVPTPAGTSVTASRAGSPGLREAPEPSARASRPACPAPPAGSPPPDAPLVLAACSGGADSMALAAALAFEAPRMGLRAGGITVDHGLQAGSAERAREVVNRLTELGLTPVEAVTVGVGRDGGPEAAARTARYRALDAAAERHGAIAVLLGHTRDDQAETVLLGLARGSGTRSLAGMPAVCGSPLHRRSTGAPAPVPAPTGARAGTRPGRPDDPGEHRRYRRPFLETDRRTTRLACERQRLPVWDDPHNADPAFTRSRVRHEALPALEKALGRGVTEALSRTARLFRDDADALDAWAERAARTATAPDGTLDVAVLGELPPAVRRRVLRRAAIAAGAPAGSLFARHIEETDRLITAWRGQRPLNLPGRVEARRQGGRLVLQQAIR
ncbi:tRNA lysidine(34) synthetase TilS [Streptomyces sp. ST2-7A]|uniref:tRNA lysidine(34) synthetase TilS n=1 Tax=Streptomyces sp. ST2-7A TaxID=2907214 RepID=UPI001F216B60|nr:tRNA lysidine(34) synthetase TilS [Streptomyces sp. ST2-7A]MCE7083182.1 tRNA lysidine(34) synthetase TilS [Streptomyces sp. ST2-7A]